MIPRCCLGVRLSAREASGPPRSQALLSSCDVICYLTPTSRRIVHRPTSSPVVWASRGLPALPWSRPGASPGCREHTLSSPTLGSAVKTSSCDSPTRVMARPRPKGPGGDPAVSRQRRQAAVGRGPSTAAHGGRGGACTGEVFWGGVPWPGPISGGVHTPTRGRQAWAGGVSASSRTGTQTSGVLKATLISSIALKTPE
jgi:hypothetical protein